MTVAVTMAGGYRVSSPRPGTGLGGGGCSGRGQWLLLHWGLLSGGLPGSRLTGGGLGLLLGAASRGLVLEAMRRVAWAGAVALARPRGLLRGRGRRRGSGRRGLGLGGGRRLVVDGLLAEETRLREGHCHVPDTLADDLANGSQERVSELICTAGRRVGGGGQKAGNVLQTERKKASYLHGLDTHLLDTW